MSNDAMAIVFIVSYTFGWYCAYSFGNERGYAKGVNDGINKLKVIKRLNRNKNV